MQNDAMDSIVGTWTAENFGFLKKESSLYTFLGVSRVAKPLADENCVLRTRDGRLKWVNGGDGLRSSNEF